ncbi:MAG: hypothetical protein MK297_09670 [Planctomycetes bacterium]|nr:hypothetical protein [Planctomycetota bacterium]
MKSTIAWGYSALIAALILGVSVIGLQRSRPMIDVRTIPLITHHGGINPQSPPGEIFECSQAGLRRIDVLLTLVGQTLRGNVTMTLRANSPGGVVLREVTMKPPVSPGVPNWASFEFEPILDSAGRAFHFSIAPADEAATKLSPWVRYHGQVGRNDPWGDRFLEAGATHKGDLISAHADLRALAFPVESMFPALGRATLSIFDDPDASAPIRTSTLELPDETHLGWAFFAFEPIAESRWKRYYFELNAPEHCRLIGTQDASMRPIPVLKSFHGRELERSQLRGMTRGSLKLPDRDLVFRAWCEDPSSAVLSRLKERTGGALWLAALLWVAATTICLRVFVFSQDTDEAETEDSGPQREDTQTAVTLGED